MFEPRPNIVSQPHHATPCKCQKVPKPSARKTPKVMDMGLTTGYFMLERWRKVT